LIDKKNRNIANIKLLSFDLDNALYDNQPVIAKAESVSSAYLNEQFQLQNKQFSFDKFMHIRQVLLASGDIRYENLTLFRRTALKSLCKNLQNADQIVSNAFDLFIQARSLATISQPIFNMLEKLSKNYTLVSVTNGNCDANKLSIADLFSKNYSASNGLRAKPHPQMLLEAAHDFKIAPHQILHIGDSVSKDGGAAAAAATGFYHFEPFVQPQDIHLCCRKLLNYLSQI